MSYGTIKVDTVTFTDGGVDKSVTLSGLVQNPTFSGNVTVTDTISGVTVTGTTASFTSGTFTNISGGTYTITSGVFAAGSAANPSISFTSDPNTGIYSPGADQVAISTNGTGRLFVDASGSISTSSTAWQGGAVYQSGGLQIGGATYVKALLQTGGTSRAEWFFDSADNYLQAKAGGFYIANTTANPIAFYTNGSERLRITSDGKLGLGTSSASNKLTIYEAAANPIRLIQDHATSSAYGIEFYSQASTPYTVSSITASHGAAYVNPYLNFNVADTSRVLQTRMVIDQQGRVGVGTTSVNTTLEVLNSSTPIIRVGDGIRHMELRGGSTGQNAAVGTNYAGSFDIIQNGGAAVTIDTSKRVLVGTSSSRTYTSLGTPQFQIEGIAYAQASIGLTNNQNVADGSYIVFNKTRGTSLGSNTIVQSGDALGAIWFQGTDGSASVLSSTISCNVEGTPAASKIASRLVFSTTADGASSPTERMRIDSSGRVGVGTTSPQALFHCESSSQELIRANSTNASGGYISVQSSGTNVIYIGSAATLSSGTATDAAVRAQSNLLFTTGGGVEKARLDTSGRLLVGTSSSIGNNDIILAATGNGNNFGAAAFRASTGGAEINLYKSRSSTVGTNTVVQSGDTIAQFDFKGADGTNYITAASIIAQVDGTPGTNDMPGRLVFSTTKDGQSSPTEACRINSTQQLLIGTSTNYGNGTRVEVRFTGGGSEYGLGLDAETLTSGTTQWVEFTSGGGTQRGTIDWSGTAVRYNTSSDYRLKENVIPVTDGLTRLQQLKPSRFNFIEYPELTVDGFIAHEVQAVVPEAVTGEKDAVDDGGKPVYQGIDQSKLVPLLTAALQEAVARIEQLETAVATLQGS